MNENEKNVKNQNTEMIEKQQLKEATGGITGGTGGKPGVADGTSGKPRIVVRYGDVKGEVDGDNEWTPPAL